MLHIPPTNLLLLAAKQELYEKAYLLTKNRGKKERKESGDYGLESEFGKLHSNPPSQPLRVFGGGGSGAGERAARSHSVVLTRHTVQTKAAHRHVVVMTKSAAIPSTLKTSSQLRQHGTVISINVKNQLIVQTAKCCLYQHKNQFIARTAKFCIYQHSNEFIVQTAKFCLINVKNQFIARTAKFCLYQHRNEFIAQTAKFCLYQHKNQFIARTAWHRHLHQR